MEEEAEKIRANELVKQFKLDMGMGAKTGGDGKIEETKSMEGTGPLDTMDATK